MSSCSLVIVHASLKNMVSRKTRLKFLVTKTGGRTWRDKKIHDFHNFSNSGLKFYTRISECICNRIMIKKISIFWPIYRRSSPWAIKYFQWFGNFSNLNFCSISAILVQKNRLEWFFCQLLSNYYKHMFQWLTRTGIVTWPSRLNAGIINDKTTI